MCTSINFAVHIILVLKHKKDDTCVMCRQRNGYEEFLIKFGLNKLKARRPHDRRVTEWTIIELLKWILIEGDIKAFAGSKRLRS